MHIDNSCVCIFLWPMWKICLIQGKINLFMYYTYIDFLDINICSKLVYYIDFLFFSSFDKENDKLKSIKEQKDVRRLQIAFHSLTLRPQQRLTRPNTKKLLNRGSAISTIFFAFSHCTTVLQMGSKTVHMTLHDQDFVHFHDLEKSSFSHIQIVDKMSYEITKV